MSPFEAQQELNALEAEAVAMKARHALEFKPLKDRAILLTRIINGDDLHDSHHAEVARKERERWAAMDRGEDAYSQAVKNWQAEAEADRQRDAERAERVKAIQQARFSEVERMSRQTTILR